MSDSSSPEQIPPPRMRRGCLNRAKIIIAAGVILILVLAIVAILYGAPSAGISQGQREYNETSTALFADSATTNENAKAVAFVIVSKSGAFLGQGVAKVYAPTLVGPNKSFLVKLDLSFESLAVTATPASDVTLVPVVEATTPAIANETLVPTSRANYTEHKINIYQLMGASLSCSSSSFMGCVDKPPSVISPGEIPAWTWELYSQGAASGDQALTIKLFTYNQVDGTDVTDVSWQHSFTIFISQNAPTDPNIIIIGVIVVSAVVLALILFFLRRPVRRTTKMKASTVSGFVSYRRSVSWGVARTLYDHLSKRGADLFIDVEGLHEGRFGDAIQQEIAKREFFLVIISDTTFDSEWVIKVVAFALSLGNKRIIPICVDGFDMYKGKIPEEINEIRNFNAVVLTPEALDAGIDRIAGFMNLVPTKSS